MAHSFFWGGGFVIHMAFEQDLRGLLEIVRPFS